METTEKKAALGNSQEVLQGQAPAGLAQKGEAASARSAKGRLWDWAKPLYLLALGYRTRENKQRELLSDILFGALCWVFSVTHGLFGAYPFALSLLAATPKRVLPCYLGALLGCCFMGKVGLLYIVVYSAVPLFRLLLSYPSKRRLFPSPVFFGEEPPLRVLVAASAGLGMAVYECVVAGVFTYTLLFSLAAILLPSLLTFFYIGALDFGVDLSYLLGKGEKGKGAHESGAFFRVSLLVFLYTVALALSRYALFGISLGGCFAAFPTGLSILNAHLCITDCRSLLLR